MKIGIFKRNQRRQLEKELNVKLRQICRRCSVPFGEWHVNGKLHIDETLYLALKRSKSLRSAKKLLCHYDELITKAENLNIKIDSSYYWINKLINKQNK